MISLFITAVGQVKIPLTDVETGLTVSKWLAQSHTANEWQHWVLKQHYLIKISLFPPQHTAVCHWQMPAAQYSFVGKHLFPKLHSQNTWTIVVITRFIFSLLLELDFFFY